MKIKETVVVEGRDDESAVLAAVSANTICTHGYGIRPEVLDIIRTAYETVGIIIFTDPDHAGLKIRERLLKLFPDAKQAFLTREQAEKDGDIGIENAKPEAILNALQAAGGTFSEGLFCRFSSCTEDIKHVTMEDMIKLGLAGSSGSSALRAKVGAILGTGSANSKTFLKRLDFMNISLEKLTDAVNSLSSDK